MQQSPATDAGRSAVIGAAGLWAGWLLQQPERKPRKPDSLPQLWTHHCCHLN